MRSFLRLSLAAAIPAFCATTQAFSWGSDRAAFNHASFRPIKGNANPSELLVQRLPRIYEVALQELQELESKPFCHRIAAQYLVQNCQLLEGKDETSVLTESGRQIRDFVDAYAASLALCDLERGRFAIPSECSLFTEQALAKLPPQEQIHLHVTPRQIEKCMTGLAKDHSAWNTWLSYRDKASRFCHAARADHEKAQNILLYRRLTKVIAKLTTDVENEIQERMDDLERRAQTAAAAMDRLGPQVDGVQASLKEMQEYILQQVGGAVKQTEGEVKLGVKAVEDLRERLLAVMESVTENRAQVAAAHEHSIEQVTKKGHEEMHAFVSAITLAATASASLQSYLDASHTQAVAIAKRQDRLEKGIERLV